MVKNDPDALAAFEAEITAIEQELADQHLTTSDAGDLILQIKARGDAVNTNRFVTRPTGKYRTVWKRDKSKAALYQ